MPEIEVRCSTCKKENVDWAWRVGNEGECIDCLYKRYGLINPKKENGNEHENSERSSEKRGLSTR